MMGHKANPLGLWTDKGRQEVAAFIGRAKLDELHKLARKIRAQRNGLGCGLKRSVKV
jgi:hypothetical protein